jgi:hypothetical protein
LLDALCSCIVPITQQVQTKPHIIPTYTSTTDPAPPPQKLRASGHSLHDQLRSINERISDNLARLQNIDAAALQERASGQSMALINTDNGARVSVTHALQQLGGERMELIKKLASTPTPPPSSDIASDFQVIESHLHAVAAKVQAQHVEESRLVGHVPSKSVLFSLHWQVAGAAAGKKECECSRGGALGGTGAQNRSSASSSD